MAGQHNQQSRFRKAFHEANAAVKSNLLRNSVNAAVSVTCLFFALQITGAYTIAEQFMDAHGWLMVKAFGVYCLLYPFLSVIGDIVRVFMETLFGNHEKPQQVKV